MGETLKKIISFQLILSYAVLISPAEEFIFYQKQKSGQLYETTESSLFQKEDENKLPSEYDNNDSLDSSLICNSSCSSAEEDNEDTLYLVHKTALYKKLLDVRSALQRELKSIDSRETLDNMWNDKVNEVIDEYIETESADCSLVDYDIVSMEKEIYNQLLNEYLYDQYSLRKNTDEKAAEVVADKLINDITKTTDSSFDAVFENINLSIKNTEVNDIIVSKTDWLESFSREIDKGLKLWEEAETDFLSMKAKWEKSAEESFVSDLEEWESGYKKLIEGKNKWNENLKSRIQEGLDLWKEKETGLNNELQNELHSFEISLSETVEQKKILLESNQTMILQLEKLIETSSEGIELWFTQWGEKYKGMYSYWKTEGCGEELSAMVNKCIEDAENNAGLKNSLNTLSGWVDSYNKYSDLKNKYLETYKNEVTTLSEKQYANDELNAEKEKINLLEKYWNSQVSINQAVYDYSVNKTSSVETMEETEKKYNEAEKAYLLMKEKYDADIAFLDDAEKKYLETKAEYEKQEKLVSELLTEYESLQNELNRIKYGVTEAELSEIKQKIITGVNLLNDYALDNAENVERYNEYCNYLLNKEYENVSANGKQLSSVLKEEQTVEVEEGVQVIESFENLKKIVEEKNKKHEDAQAELIQLENRLAIIEFLETGLVDEKKYVNKIDVETIVSEYGKYSINYVKKCDSEILKSISEIVKKSKDKEIEELNIELDECLEKFHSDYIDSIVDIYKTQITKLLDKRSVKTLEERLSEIYESEIKVNEKNYNISLFENIFDLVNVENECTLTESDAKKNYELIFENENKYETTYIRLLSLIEELDEKNNKYNDYNSSVKILNDKLEKARTDYIEETSKLDVKNKDGIYVKLLDDYDKYNAEYQLAEKDYSKLYELKLELNVAEKVRNWAMEEYLHVNNVDEKNISPLDNLNDSKAQLENCRKISEILNAVTDVKLTKEDEKVLSEYEYLTHDFYVFENLNLELESRLNDQKEKAVQSKANEYKALINLVKEFDYTEKDSVAISKMVEDFVYVDKVTNIDGTYSYDFHLAVDGVLKSYDHSNLISAEVKEKTAGYISEYLTEKNVVQYDVEGKKYEFSSSLCDAIDFFVSLENKNYGIDDLLLAVCYLKSKSNEDDLYFEKEDPSSKENYPFSIPTENLFGMNFGDEYESGRISEVASAYYKILNNGGLDDIAKFIFYSAYNLNDEIELKNREIDVIACRGLQSVIDKVEEKKNGYVISGVALTASAAVLGATAAIPVIGAWAIAPCAALLIAAAACFVNAGSLDECNNDIKNIQNGYSGILSDYQNGTSSLINTYLYAKNKTVEETEKYNLMLYGSEVSDDVDFTFENFNKAVNAIYGTSDFLYSLKDTDGKTYDIEKLYNQLNQESQITNTVEGLNALYKYFNNLYENVTEKVSSHIASRDSVHNENMTKLNALMSDLMPSQDSYEYEQKNAENIITSCFNENSWNKNLFLTKLNNIYASIYLTDEKLFAGQQFDFENIFSYIEATNKALLDNSSEIKLNEKIFDLTLQKQDFNSSQNEWIGWMNYALACGESEWKKAESNFENNFESWKKNWEKEFQSNEKQLNEEYQKLVQSKSQWVNEQYVNGVLVNSPDELIETTMKESSKLISEMNKASALIEADVVDNKFLNVLDNYLTSLNDTAVQKCITQMNRNLIDFDQYMYSSVVTNKISELEKEITDKAALYAAQLAESLLDNRFDNINELVNQQNENLTKWENDLVRRDGYTVGDEIYRNAIVDSTLGQIAVRERQTVHKYEWFVFANPFVSSYHDFKNLDSDSINVLLNKRFTDLDKWYEKIFGNETSEGEFSKHVGEAPEFVDNIDTSKGRFENISKNGSGEMGIIMLDYIWNSVKNSEGYAQLGTPLYDKKLTRDNKVLGIELPTIRDITQIVCDIVANGTGQKWFSYFDDVAYGVMDAAFQTKTADQIFADLGKSLVSSGVGAAASCASSAISNVAGGVLSTLATAAINTSASYLTTVTNSYIDAIDFKNGFNVNWDQANQVWTDSNVIKNAVSAGVSYSVKTAVNFGLNELTLKDGLGVQLNSNVFNTSGIASLNNTLSTLAASASEAAFTGKFSLNLISTKDIGINLENDIGLFNVTFDKDGVSASISESGNVVGIRQLLSGIGGIKDSLKVLNAKVDNQNGNAKNLATLNAVNALSYTLSSDNTELAKDIWENRIKVKFEEMKENELGYFNKEMSDSINVNSKYIDNTFVSTVELASVLSHEGSHLNGNDIEAMSQMAGLQTYINLSTLYDIELNQDLMAQMISSITDENNWNPSEGNVEWWKLSSNGTLTFDRSGWLVDENNEKIKDVNGKEIGSAGILTGLLNILYQTEDGVFTEKSFAEFSEEQKAFARELMSDACIKRDPINESYYNNKCIYKLNTDKIMKNCSATVADAVYLNYYDTVADTWFANYLNVDLGFNGLKQVYVNGFDRFNRIYTNNRAANPTAEQLVEKYKFTLTKKDGTEIKLFKINETNPFTDEIIKQYHPFLYDQTNAKGCCFMSVLAVPQLLTGKILSYRDVRAIWELGIEEKGLERDGTVCDANKLSDTVLKYMGIKDFKLRYINNYNEVKTKVENLVAERIKVKYSTTGHFTVGSPTNNILYNPHATVNDIQRRDGVFIYAE